MDTRKHHGGYRSLKGAFSLTPIKILLAIVCVGILLAVSIGQERTTTNRRTPTPSRTPIPSPVRTSPQRIPIADESVRDTTTRVPPQTKTLIEATDHTAQGMTINITFGELKWDTVEQVGRRVKYPVVDGGISTMEAGAPDLPVITKLFQIPAARARVKILQVDEVPITVGELARIPENTKLTDDESAPSTPARIPDRPDIYRNAYFPNQWVTVEELGLWRGHRLGTLKMFPLRVNPATGQGIWVKRVVLQVTFEGARPNPIDSRPLTKTEQTTLLNMLGPLGETPGGAPVLFAREREPDPQIPVNFIPGITQYKMFVSREGLYHITYQYLVNAGISVLGIDPRNLRLRNKGQDIPIYVSGETDGRFDPQDYIEFYGYPNQKTYIDQYYHDMYKDPYSDVNVYWLSWASPAQGLRLIEESRPPIIPEAQIGTMCHVPYNFMSSVHQELDGNFQRLSATALYTLQDHWFMDNGIVGLQSRNYSVNLAYPDSFAIDSAHIRIALTGFTFGEGSHLGSHHAKVWLNNQSTAALDIGRDLSSWTWFGQTPVVADTREVPGGGIPQRTVVHGINQVRIDCSGDTPDGSTDAILVNWFDVIYPRLFRAYQNQLRFNAPAGRPSVLVFHQSPEGYPTDTLYHFSLDNFSSSDISLYKLAQATPNLMRGQSVITNFTVEWVEDPASGINSFVLKFQDYITEPVEYLALTQSHKLTPDSIKQCTSTGRLSSPSQPGASYIVITAPAFLTNQYLDSLLIHRSADYDTMLVSTKEIYDEFNHGIMSPFAIKNFLTYAYYHWSIPPEMVLLAGDLVYDFKNITGYGGVWVPSIYVNGKDSGWYPSDFSYSLISGDDYIPDLGIGRIPCRSQSELQRVVQKILTYERNSRWGPWRDTFLFISSKTWDEQSNFTQATREIMTSLPDYIITQLLEEDSGRVYTGARTQLRNLFNRQANANLVTIYNGHGAGGTWSGTLWLTSDIAAMSNSLNLPFITNFTCYICAFDTRESPGDEELMGEEFLMHQANGAIAVYGSVSLGWFQTGKNYQLILLPIMAQIPGPSLGDIISFSKALLAAGASESHIYTTLHQMVLLGDPAVILNAPQRQLLSPSNGGLTPDPFVNPGDAVTMTITPPCSSGTGDLRMHTHLGTSPYPTQYDSSVAFGDSTITMLFPWEKHIAFANNNIASNLIIPDTCFTFLAPYFDDHPVAQEGSIRGYFYNSTLKVDAAAGLMFYRNDVFSDTVLISRISTIPDTLFPNQLWHFKARVFTPLVVSTVKTFYTLRNGSDSLIAQDSLSMSPVSGQPFYWQTDNSIGPYAAYPIYPEYYQWTMNYLIRVRYSGSHEIFSGDTTKFIEDDRPNLAYVAPARIALGGNRVVTVLDTIYNTGMSSVDSALVQYYISNQTGSYYQQIVLRNIPANSAIPISFPQSFLAGNYTVSIIIDPGNWVEETSETDNTGYMQLIVDHFQVIHNLGTVFPDSGVTSTVNFDGDNFAIRIPPGGIAQDSAVLVIRKVNSVEVSAQGNIEIIPLWTWGYEVLFGDSSVQLRQDSLPTWITIKSPTIQMSDSLWNWVAPYCRQPGSQFWTRVPNDSLIPLSTHVKTIRGEPTTLGIFAALSSRDTCGTSCGPLITISVEGQLFGEGSYVPTHPKITALLQDYSGIDRSVGQFWVAYGEANGADSTVLQTDEVVWTDTLTIGGTMGVTISPVFAEGSYWVAFFATDNNGNHTYRRFNFQVAGQFDMLYVGNYPNPFRTRTLITYTLTDQAAERVRMKIYTVSGRLIRTMYDPNPHPVNYREVIWDGKDDEGNPVANGVYFCRIRAVKGAQTIEKTMKLAKIR